MSKADTDIERAARGRAMSLLVTASPRMKYEPAAFTRFPVIGLPPSVADRQTFKRFPNPVDKRGRMRVLLVEDDRQLRAVLAIFCRSLGAEVLAESADGLEALDQLRTARPDLILTDCQMPRMDGIALVRQLRAQGDRTPVIMISGQLDPLVVARAYEAGVSCYLPKPLSSDSLSTAIGRTCPNWAA